jgi:hypothetical protein
MDRGVMGGQGNEQRPSGLQELAVALTSPNPVCETHLSECTEEVYVEYDQAMDKGEIDWEKDVVRGAFLRMQAEAIFDRYLEALMVWEESLGVTAATEDLVSVKTAEVPRLKAVEHEVDPMMEDTNQVSVQPKDYKLEPGRDVRQPPLIKELALSGEAMRGELVDMTGTQPVMAGSPVLSVYGPLGSRDCGGSTRRPFSPHKCGGHSPDCGKLS